MRGERTSWYPSMRLFRQMGRSGWKPVLKAASEELAAPSPPLPKPVAAETYLSAIHQKFEDRDYAAAQALLSNFGWQYPGHDKISRWTALCLYRQDELEEALPWAERAMVEQPENAENHRVLGIIQQGLLQFDDAERTLRAGMRLAPQRADLRSALFMQLLL